MEGDSRLPLRPSGLDGYTDCTSARLWDRPPGPSVPRRRLRRTSRVRRAWHAAFHVSSFFAALRKFCVGIGRNLAIIVAHPPNITAMSRDEALNHSVRIGTPCL